MTAKSALTEGGDRDLRADARSPAKQWARSLLWSAYALLILAMVALLPRLPGLAGYFFVKQDLPVAVGAILLWLHWSRRPASAAVPGWQPPRGALAAMLAFVVLAGIAGHFLILSNYAMSRDEAMALFDARVFAGGDVIGRVPAAWQFIRPALGNEFMMDLGPAAWISEYRPGNALLHAPFVAMGAGWLTNPLLAGAGLIATWQVTRILWPDDAGTRGVVLLLYTLSTQALFASMTSYAMTGHLAINMLWLWAYLRGGVRGHGAAIAVGAIGVGLHQILYHPLFVAPFLMLLAWQRRWKPLAVYLIAYAAIGVFWLMYSRVPQAASGFVPAAADRVAGAGYIGAALAGTIGKFGPGYLVTSAANILRFFAWQHLLLLPLMIVGIGAVRRSRDPLAWAIIGAFVLTLAAKIMLRPYQGHGWGFRYMHGVIGAAALIAGYGWASLKERGAAPVAMLRTATALTVLAAMPFLAVQAWRFSHPYAAVSARIDRQTADVAIIDADTARYATDLVYNDPAVTRRPVRVAAEYLRPVDLARLCAVNRVTLIDRAALAPLRRWTTIAHDQESSEMRALRAAMPAGCARPILP